MLCLWAAECAKYHQSESFLSENQRPEATKSELKGEKWLFHSRRKMVSSTNAKQCSGRNQWKAREIKGKGQNDKEKSTKVKLSKVFGWKKVQFSRWKVQNCNEISKISQKLKRKISIFKEKFMKNEEASQKRKKIWRVNWRIFSSPARLAVCVCVCVRMCEWV